MTSAVYRGRKALNQSINQSINLLKFFEMLILTKILFSTGYLFNQLIDSGQYTLNATANATLFYAPDIRRMRKGIKRCPCPSVRACVCASFCASVRPSFKWVLCERNSSYNFIPILLKLYSCFCQGLKMCMTFGYNPQINFCHFFHSLNLVIFWLNYY